MTTIEFERERLHANIASTDHRIEAIEAKYPDAMCCPSCGAAHSAEHGIEYRRLLEKQIARQERLKILDGKLKAHEAVR